MSTEIRFIVGDVRDVLAAMPDSSVDLLVTSPPFLALRSYLPADHPDKHREIGSETTPAAFLDTMLGLTADWRRVVADWGSIAVEIGDTYSGSGGAGGDYGDGGMRNMQPRFAGSGSKHRMESAKPGSNSRLASGNGWPLSKSLCGIPTLYTWSLAYGRNLLTGDPSPAGEWRVRNLLTWTRPNPPVGALGDKFRPATSFVTVATVDDKRWFDLDAVRTPVRPEEWRKAGQLSGESYGGTLNAHGQRIRHPDPAGAPPLDWWDANDLDPDDWQPLHRLPTQPYKGSHYAAFPVALPRRLIDAMCPSDVCTTCGEPRRRIVEREKVGSRTIGAAAAAKPGGTDERLGPDADRFTDSAVRTIGWTDCGHDTYRPGIVLDPFGGSGTTAVAAAQAGRDAVLIDLDHRNVDLARHRIADAMRIVNEHHDGNTWTWTIDADMPGLKGQHPDQLSLLDETAS